ncbi:hypothetical protein [Kribbella sp. CA-294648]|uniref:hypothetical protein n=1 Tax=Kribbella sp. CA-294648 TaxID=3239948 RepID=UPI003D94A11F
MTRDDELGALEDVLQDRAVWEQTPADVEQRILSELRSDRPSGSRRPDDDACAEVFLTGTSLMRQARAEGTANCRPRGVELTLDFTGLPSARGPVYRAWLTVGGDGVPIGSFQLPHGSGRVFAHRH